MGFNGKPTDDSIKEELKNFSGLDHFLRSRPEFLKYAYQFKRNVNDGMISVFDVEKRYYVDELMNELQKSRDYASINLVKRLVTKHIAESSPGRGENLYEKFVQSLFGKSSSEVAVISFNFDCWLHEDLKRGIYFDYLLDFKTVRNRGHYEKGQGIPLIKPNGSLDWAGDPQTGEKHLFFWYVRPETYYLRHEEQNNFEMVEPCIFLPHQTKDKSMEALWKMAKAELKQADKIIIIGYSFPDYDTDVIKLFQESIGCGIELEVVDLAPGSNKQNEIQNKYNRFFPDIANVKFNFDGFQGYMARENILKN